MQLGKKLRSVTMADGGKGLAFFCPGCKHMHMIKIAGPGPQPNWHWDNDIERPTFAPSILVTSGHYAVGHVGPCWCDYNQEELLKDPKYQPDFVCTVCHCFVRQGMLEYLSDCTHELARKTVPLPDLPDLVDF